MRKILLRFFFFLQQIYTIFFNLNNLLTWKFYTVFFGWGRNFLISLFAVHTEKRTTNIYKQEKLIFFCYFFLGRFIFEYYKRYKYSFVCNFFLIGNQKKRGWQDIEISQSHTYKRVIWENKTEVKTLFFCFFLSTFF